MGRFLIALGLSDLPATARTSRYRSERTDPLTARCVRIVDKAEECTMGTILLIILIILLLGALPTWPYSSGWGYYPSGGLGLILLIVIILLVLGRI
jgi:MFS superfamily sulfate permease-like transporter